MPGTQYPQDTVQLYTHHFFCPVLLLHIPPDGLQPPPPRRRPSPVCTTPIPSLRMLIPVHFTPLFVVCLSAPVLHANYVAQFLFLFFNRSQAGSALPLAFYPVIHPKDVDTSTFLLPPPMADNGTSISHATMPIRDARPLREGATWRSCAH